MCVLCPSPCGTAHHLPTFTMRLTSVISMFAILVFAVVSPTAVAVPANEGVIAARGPSPGLVARAPTPSLAARAPAPSGSLRKRALRQKPLTPEEVISQHLCPAPMRACPLNAQSAPTTLTSWITEGFECVDPQEDLFSCGGCATVDTKCVLVSVPPLRIILTLIVVRV